MICSHLWCEYPVTTVGANEARYDPLAVRCDKLRFEKFSQSDLRYLSLLRGSILDLGFRIVADTRPTDVHHLVSGFPGRANDEDESELLEVLSIRIRQLLSQ